MYPVYFIVKFKYFQLLYYMMVSGLRGLLDKIRDYHLIGIVSVIFIGLGALILIFLLDLTDYGISIAAIAASLFTIISTKKEKAAWMIILAYILSGISAFIGIFSGLNQNISSVFAVRETVNQLGEVFK